MSVIGNRMNKFVKKRGQIALDLLGNYKVDWQLLSISKLSVLYSKKSSLIILHYHKNSF